jgi:hypothetical protein
LPQSTVQGTLLAVDFEDFQEGTRMDSILTQQMAELGAQLSLLVSRNSAVAIGNRITAAKAKQRDQERINELEGILDDVIRDFNDTSRIAETYRQEFVAQHRSPEDIEYITDTIVPMQRKLIELSPDKGNSAAARQMEEALNLFAPLLSVEALTVMQLLLGQLS